MQLSDIADRRVGASSKVVYQRSAVPRREPIRIEELAPKLELQGNVTVARLTSMKSLSAVLAFPWMAVLIEQAYDEMEGVHTRRGMEIRAQMGEVLDLLRMG